MLRRRRRKRKKKKSRWPGADRLRHRERGAFSEGRGLALLWPWRLLCHRGPQRDRFLWCQCPPPDTTPPHPQSSSPTLAHCHSPLFLISQKQSSVTQTVYLACLPQPGKEKRGGWGGQTHEPESLHKIILHNTREFKEALPIPPLAPHLPLMKKGGGGGLREGKKGGAGGHQKKAVKFTPRSRLGLLIIVFRVQQSGY